MMVFKQEGIIYYSICRLSEDIDMYNESNSIYFIGEYLETGPFEVSFCGKF